MADVTYIPDSGNQNNNLWPWLLAGNGYGGFGGWGGGLGTGILGFLLGALVNNGGFGGLFGGGGWGGGAGAGAGFLSNQINNDSGRELLMNAITSQGEAGRAATQNLATMLGQDFNLVNGGVSAIRDGIAALTAQTGMSALQIVNAIQAGNADLASQLCKCCCDNKLLVTSQGYENQLRTVEQTNTLDRAIDGASQRNVDAIADLKTTMVKEFCDAKERDMQNEINRQGEIITQLRGQIDNDRQTAAIAAMLAPIQKEVDDIRCKQPQTVPVIWPNLAAVNTTPYVSGGYYQGGFNGLYGGGVPGFNF